MTPLRFFVAKDSPLQYARNLDFYRVFAHIRYLTTYVHSEHTLYVHTDGAGISCLYPASKIFEVSDNAQEWKRLVLVVGGARGVGGSPAYHSVVASQNLTLHVIYHPHTVLRRLHEFIEVKDPAVYSAFESDLQHLELNLTLEQLNA